MEDPAAKSAVSQDEIPKRNELLLTYARTAFENEHHRYEWGEVKISRYLTVITIVIGLASVRLPELISALGHLRGWIEWAFVIAYAVSAAAAVVSLLFALSGLTYARVPNLAIDADMVSAVRDNALEIVVPGLAERYLEAARALRGVNAGRFLRGERAYWAMTTAVLSAALATLLYVLLTVKGTHP
jgi:hypothetical protein